MTAAPACVPARVSIRLTQGHEGVVKIAGHSFPCTFGRGGIVSAEEKKEGDGATPTGRYELREIFYRADRIEKPATSLKTTKIEKGMAWGDDPADPATYNRLIHGAPLDHPESLWREDNLYDLVIIIGYNDTPPVPGKGSAIFIHTWRGPGRPTAGCIALARPDLLMLAETLVPGSTVDIS